MDGGITLSGHPIAVYSDSTVVLHGYHTPPPSSK